MNDTLRVGVADLRRATEMLLDHVEAELGAVVDVPDRMFWVIPPKDRYDVYQQPQDLDVGQLGDSLASLLSTVETEEDVLAYGLVWLADIVRAVGEQTVR